MPRDTETDPPLVLDAPTVETNADWTIQIAARVSKRAVKALDDKLASKELGMSRASYLRKLIYADLGLITKES